MVGPAAPMDGFFPVLCLASACRSVVFDAMEPGGSGDMYAGLNDEERAVLAEVTRMGFPPPA